MSIYKLSVLVTLLLTLAIISACGDKQSRNDHYPSKPITLYVPWAAGGMTDMSSRMMAATLQKHLGQSINVVNRTGGGGVIGHLALAQAKPDGYTLGAVTGEITQLHHLGLTQLTYGDYTPLALMLYNPAAITVRQGAPWNTIAELLAAIKREPSKLRASGTARGGVWDIARIGFLMAAGLSPSDVPWIPSQGSSPALQELLSGGVDIVTASLAEVDALRQAGQVKTLAVMASSRLDQFPEVPTLQESGIDWVIGGWVSICAPSGLPDPIKSKLDSALYIASMDTTFVHAMTQAGAILKYMDSQNLLQFMQAEDLSNSALMKTAGLTR